MRILLLAEQERLVAARFPLEAEAVEEAGLRHLRNLLGALLLLHSGPVEAAAAALVEDLSVDLVSAQEKLFFPQSLLLHHVSITAFRIMTLSITIGKYHARQD